MGDTPLPPNHELPPVKAAGSQGIASMGAALGRVGAREVSESAPTTKRRPPPRPEPGDIDEHHEPRVPKISEDAEEIISATKRLSGRENRRKVSEGEEVTMSFEEFEGAFGSGDLTESGDADWHAAPVLKNSAPQVSNPMAALGKAVGKLTNRTAP